MARWPSGLKRWITNTSIVGSNPSAGIHCRRVSDHKQVRIKHTRHLVMAWKVSCLRALEPFAGKSLCVGCNGPQGLEKATRMKVGDQGGKVSHCKVGWNCVHTVIADSKPKTLLYFYILLNMCISVVLNLMFCLTHEIKENKNPTNFWICSVLT